MVTEGRVSKNSTSVFLTGVMGGLFVFGALSESPVFGLSLADSHAIKVGAAVCFFLWTGGHGATAVFEEVQGIRKALDQLRKEFEWGNLKLIRMAVEASVPPEKAYHD
jgi:hypothetical protein